MTRLYRYLLRQILLPSSLALLVIGFLATSNALRGRASRLPAEVVGLSDLGLLAILFLPSVVSYIVPTAFFFGILMGLGRLGSHGEITAMASAGVSHKRIAAPIIVVGAGLSLICMLVQEYVQPWAIHKAYDLLEHELPQRATLDTLQPGIMHQYGDWRVYFAYRDPRNRALYEVDIVRPDESGAPWVFHAESATLKEQSGARILTLRNGHFVSPDNLRSDFDSQELILPEYGGIASSRRLRLGKNLAGLFETERALTDEFARSPTPSVRMRLLKERQEIADRLSLPFATLALSFSGIPLALSGAGRRRGSRAQLFSTGIGVLLLYYLLRSAIEPRSLHDLNDYLLRVWIPNLILIGLGLVLIWRLDHSASAG